MFRGQMWKYALLCGPLVIVLFVLPAFLLMILALHTLGFEVEAAMLLAAANQTVTAVIWLCQTCIDAVRYALR